MRFRFNIINTDIFKLNKDKDEADFATYEFTIYRNRSTGKPTPIYQIGILSYWGMFIVGHKQLAVENVSSSDDNFRPGEIRFLPHMETSEKAMAVVSGATYNTSTDVAKQFYDNAKKCLKAKFIFLCG